MEMTVSGELDDIIARVGELEDEREIRYLVGRYGHYADLGYEDAWVDQWTGDGVYDLETVKRDGAGYDGPARFEGRDALYALIRDPAAHKRLEGRSLHVQDINLVVRIEGDTAFAHGYSMTLMREGDEVRLRGAGLVRWSFRREGGRWRIAGKTRRGIGDGSAFADTPATPAHDAARVRP